MSYKLISLIATVYNEEETIEQFLKSILNQEILPDEIIIVDGGSKDKTFEILKEYESRYKDLIKVYRLENANIAQGRNYAIKESKGIIIVTADAGCIYSKDYIRTITLLLLKYLLINYEKFGLKKENILEYIKNKEYNLDEIENSKEAEFVQGRYYPYYETDFEYFVGLMLVKKKQCKIPSRASARATAYFKYVWESVGGYPERFITGEDTLFNYEILKKGFKWRCVNTKVYWKMPKNLEEFYKKFERYAIGDILQGNIIKNKKLILFISSFWIYIALLATTMIYNKLYVFLFLIFLALLYLISISFKAFKENKNWKAFIYVPLLEITRRVAYQIGFIKGLIKKI